MPEQPLQHPPLRMLQSTPSSKPPSKQHPGKTDKHVARSCIWAGWF